jgi:DNA helicase MCM8
MVASLCPSIFGHELVKAALILCLFGGASSNKDDLLSRRDDINMLMVGDPGIGKSQMLKVVAEVAPRGELLINLTVFNF